MTKSKAKTTDASEGCKTCKSLQAQVEKLKERLLSREERKAKLNDEELQKIEERKQLYREKKDKEQKNIEDIKKLIMKSLNI